MLHGHIDYYHYRSSRYSPRRMEDAVLDKIDRERGVRFNLSPVRKGRGRRFYVDVYDDDGNIVHQTVAKSRQAAQWKAARYVR